VSATALTPPLSCDDERIQSDYEPSRDTAASQRLSIAPDAATASPLHSLPPFSSHPRLPAAAVSRCQVVGFIVGYVVQSFRVTFLWSCAGLLVALVVCLPDWPWYNRHPLKWREPAAPAPELAVADSAAAAQLNGSGTAGDTEEEGAADTDSTADAAQAVQRKKGKSGKKKKKAAAAAAGQSH
jgi:hypothetical protein